MKKKMQKYLSGSNEGFSLVELIIVIAIMAILVGVVALAVIPNLERSRESKDLSTLDSACQALSVAVANAGAKAGKGSMTVAGNGSGSFDGSDVGKLLAEQLDAKTLTLASSICSAIGEITLEWDTTNGANVCKAYVSGATAAKYAKNDQGDPAKFEVVGGDTAGTP